MLEAIQAWAGLAILCSITLSVVGFGLAAWMIVSMPPDHFLETDHPAVQRHPLLHLIWLAFKNASGLTLIALGVVMSFVPGPGLLAILLGASIVDLPGKRWLLNRGLRLRSVRRTLNWLRRKFGKQAFKFPNRAG